LTQENQESEEGVYLAGFLKFTAGKKERLETGGGCAGCVQGGTIANVKNFGGLEVKLLGGLLEDGGRGFALADFTGDDDGLKEAVEI